MGWANGPQPSAERDGGQQPGQGQQANECATQEPRWPEPHADNVVSWRHDDAEDEAVCAHDTGRVTVDARVPTGFPVVREHQQASVVGIDDNATGSEDVGGPH